MTLKKVLIADDHAMTRKGIELLVKTSFSQAEIIEAGNGREAICQYNQHKPDVVLMDYNMPELNGYDAANYLLKIDNGIKIILLTMFDTKPIVFNFLKIGGKGFIWKGGPSEDICDGVRTVASGDYYFSSIHEKEITDWMKKGDTEKVPKIKFTPLELGILVKISKGKTSKEIGEELNLSLRTIETYRYDLIRKAQVKNTSELIEYLFRNGIGL